MRISVNDIIMWIMAIGFVIGGLDYMAGDRMGLGRSSKRALIFWSSYVEHGGPHVPGAGIFPRASRRSCTGQEPEPMIRHGGQRYRHQYGWPCPGHGADGKPPDRCILRHRRLFHAVPPSPLLFPRGYLSLRKRPFLFCQSGLMLGLITVPVGCFAGAQVMGISVQGDTHQRDSGAGCWRRCSSWGCISSRNG